MSRRVIFKWVTKINRCLIFFHYHSSNTNIAFLQFCQYKKNVDSFLSYQSSWTSPKRRLQNEVVICMLYSGARWRKFLQKKIIDQAYDKNYAVLLDLSTSKIINVYYLSKKTYLTYNLYYILSVNIYSRSNITLWNF